MLILGTRGLGFMKKYVHPFFTKLIFRRMVLGSVSDYCVGHSGVPTLVIPLESKSAV